MAADQPGAHDPHAPPNAQTAMRASCAARPVKLSPERVQYLRTWLAAGGHNRPSVMRALARRIIESEQSREHIGGG